MQQCMRLRATRALALLSSAPRKGPIRNPWATPFMEWNPMLGAGDCGPRGNLRQLRNPRRFDVWWECNECGMQFWWPNKPMRCDVCGTAGTDFFAVMDEDAPYAGLGDCRSSWVEAGLFWSETHDRSPLDAASHRRGG